MYDVVALGELLIDFTCMGQDQEGYPAMAAHPGGAPANFLAAVNSFGGKTALLSKVGADAFGKMLIETMRTLKIETKGIVQSEECFTTLAFVTLDETGNREFSFARKPGADTQLSCDELRLELIEQAKAFHFGTLSLTDEPARSATYQAVTYAKQRGKLITCDPNLRKPLWKDEKTAKEQLLWALNMADVIKISDEEVDFLYGLTPEEGARWILGTTGAKLVFVTCGADGCFFANGKASGWCPALQGITVADTTGAGDIFSGSAVWKLLQYEHSPDQLTEKELIQVVRFATASAGLSTTRPGGIYSVPVYEEVLARL